MNKQREIELDIEKTQTILERTSREIAKKTFTKAIAQLEGRAPYPKEHEEYIERNPLRFLLADGLGDISLTILQVAEGITALGDDNFEEPPPIREEGNGAQFVGVDGVKHWDSQEGYPLLSIMGLVANGVKMTVDYYRLLLEDYLTVAALAKEDQAKEDQAKEDQAKEDQE